MAGTSKCSASEDSAAASHQQQKAGRVRHGLLAQLSSTLLHALSVHPQLGFGRGAESPAPAHSKSNSRLLRAGV